MDTKKYTPVKSSRILTNDLYLAAYLLNQGHKISVNSNGRQRITFSIDLCDEVLEMRDLYRSKKALVDISSFRDSLKAVRQLMSQEQRSLRPCLKSQNQLLTV